MGLEHLDILFIICLFIFGVSSLYTVFCRPSKREMENLIREERERQRAISKVNMENYVIEHFRDFTKKFAECEECSHVFMSASMQTVQVMRVLHEQMVVHLPTVEVEVLLSELKYCSEHKKPYSKVVYPRPAFMSPNEARSSEPKYFLFEEGREAGFVRINPDGTAFKESK